MNAATSNSSTAARSAAIAAAAAADGRERAGITEIVIRVNIFRTQILVYRVQKVVRHSNFAYFLFILLIKILLELSIIK